VNWASHVDPDTGRPVESDIAKSIRAGNPTEMWPSTQRERFVTSVPASNRRGSSPIKGFVKKSPDDQ
jgi:hypothetical protein